MKFFFETSLEHLFFQTPWFYIWISNGGIDWQQTIRWWGFEFSWGKNTSNELEAASYFGHTIRYESQIITLRELYARD